MRRQFVSLAAGAALVAGFVSGVTAQDEPKQIVDVVPAAAPAR